MHKQPNNRDKMKLISFELSKTTELKIEIKKDSNKTNLLARVLPKATKPTTKSNETITLVPDVFEVFHCKKWNSLVDTTLPYIYYLTNQICS